MKRILIADDRDASRELIRTVLESSGYAVTEAADGLQAVELAKKCGPDLLLIDLRMPGLDGFGVMSELRNDSRFQRVPFVALTASAMQGDRERALDAGFNAYMTKPISLSELRRELSRLLEQ